MHATLLPNSILVGGIMLVNSAQGQGDLRAITMKMIVF
jgi:hypothetical protein